MGRKRKNTTSTTTLSPKSAKGDRDRAEMTHLSDSEPKKRNPLREVCTYLDYERNGWHVD